jgi:hypothetical protein
MARKKEVKNDNSYAYIAIVAIVAIVAVVLLGQLNNEKDKIIFQSDDLIGNAISSKHNIDIENQPVFADPLSLCYNYCYHNDNTTICYSNCLQYYGGHIGFLV